MLKALDVPTLVLHDEDDPLIPVSHGHDTAAHIADARIKTDAGWGQDRLARIRVAALLIR